MSKSHNFYPTIGISCGDINGIGPEVIIKTLSDERILKNLTPVIYGSGRAFARYRKLLDLPKFNFSQIDSIDQVKKKRVNLINASADDCDVQPGSITEEAGKISLASLQASANDLVAGHLNALVTAPINKDNIQAANFDFPGHTEFLTQLAGKQDSLMLMTCEHLKIGVATGHIPLKDVSKNISKNLIIEKTLILNQTLKEDFGINKPKIAILGLNPHAGENGLLGSEEKEIIYPAIEELKKKNVLAMGPMPADGFFGTYQFKHYDAVLAMYHDQGLIPFKTIAFDQGVNYTAGLPIIRTSPDHGTAYDLAGKNQADPSSFRHALFAAHDIAKTRFQTAD